MDDKAVTELLLVRHGHVQLGVTKRYKASSDPPLSPLGCAQASQLACILTNEPGLVALYTSPLQRACETAQILGSQLGLQPSVCGNLREWDFRRPMGLLDRLRLLLVTTLVYFSVFRHIFRRQLARIWVRSRALQAFTRTVMECIEEIIQRHPGQRVIVVAHGGTLHAVLGYYFPQEDEWERGAIRHSSLTRIRLEGNAAYLLDFNRVFVMGERND